MRTVVCDVMSAHGLTDMPRDYELALAFSVAYFILDLVIVVLFHSHLGDFSTYIHHFLSFMALGVGKVGCRSSRLFCDPSCVFADSRSMGTSLRTTALLSPWWRRRHRL
jgi:hypothetical protein